MSRPKFSKDFRTYGDWLKAKSRDTRYAKEIIRKHQMFPDKSLSQLRKLRMNDYDLSKAPWKALSSQQKRERNLSLEILRSLRKGESLTQVLKKRGLRTDFALKNLGNNLQKSNGKWVVNKTDSLEVEMLIYSKGGVKTIVTASSKDRSLIAKYFNDVQRALKDPDKPILKKYKNLKIIDAEGKEHHFETDLEKLYEIRDAQEEPEFLEIYPN
ncbi:hypothetical protein RE476_03580 [Methanolobus mangrovi]|uniref:Uncharacterized protein n=1 Tax=Methanolobus mangrovi TaxID=3072977 RepID=A0AA51UJM6_9EURY|nr:hypothetical protein [Methanolobus mangrovi]WMW22916.1 hypothetical protein RE476_03580 [Methanolobus mangrovi]